MGADLLLRLSRMRAISHIVIVIVIGIVIVIVARLLSVRSSRSLPKGVLGVRSPDGAHRSLFLVKNEETGSQIIKRCDLLPFPLVLGVGGERKKGKERMDLRSSRGVISFLSL